MSQVEQIERLVEGLGEEDFAKFREWFLEHEWKSWDEQIARDRRSGKLDKLIDKAMADFKAGKAREI